MQGICICIGIPEPCLRLNRLAAFCFAEKWHACVWSLPFVVNISQYVVISLMFEGTKHIWNAKAFKRVAFFFLSFYLDVIGDQQDVQYLCLCHIYLVYVALYLHFCYILACNGQSAVGDMTIYIHMYMSHLYIYIYSMIWYITQCTHFIVVCIEECTHVLVV